MKTKILRIIKYLLLAMTIMPAMLTFAEENVLRLLVWEGYTPEAYVQKFEEEIELKYGIPLKIEISYAINDDDFINLTRDKKVDVISITHYSIKDKKFKYIPRGLILPLDLKNIPNYVNLIPDFKDADYDKDNENIYAIPVANGPYGLAYNTKMFKQAPQSWEIFWNPAYKYKYAIGASEYLYNIKITAMVMGYSRDMLSSFDVLNNKKFRDKLRQLTANAGSFWSGIDKPENLLGMSIAMVWGDSLTSLRKMGEEWKMADPLEGTIWWIDEYAITWALEEKPVLKKIAEEWINKSLSLDFQINHIFGELKAHPIVTFNTEKLPAKEKKVVENNPELDFFKGKRILQHTYSQRDKNGLKLMWDKAMEGVPIKRENK